MVHPLQQLRAADGVVQGAAAQPREQAADILRDPREVRDHLFRCAAELGAQLGPLGGDPGGAGVQVTLPRHVAPDRDERRRAEAEALGAEQRGDHDVTARAQPTVHPHFDPVPEAVLDEDRLGLREPQLPR